MSRNRLSSIDLLPPEADDDIVWAVREIEAGKRLLKDVLKEFNARLADRGIGAISDSAWTRYAVRKRAAFQELKEVRDISNAIVASLEPGSDDALTIAVAQFAKTAAFKLFQQGTPLDSKSIMEIGKAVQSIESAKRTSATVRKEVEREIAQKAAQTIESVAKEAGLSSERIAQLRREFLGVRPKKKAETSVPSVGSSGAS